MYQREKIHQYVSCISVGSGMSTAVRSVPVRGRYINGNQFGTSTVQVHQRQLGMYQRRGRYINGSKVCNSAGEDTSMAVRSVSAQGRYINGSKVCNSAGEDTSMAVRSVPAWGQVHQRQAGTQTVYSDTIPTRLIPKRGKLERG